MCANARCNGAGVIESVILLFLAEVKCTCSDFRILRESLSDIIEQWAQHNNDDDEWVLSLSAYDVWYARLHHSLLVWLVSVGSCWCMPNPLPTQSAIVLTLLCWVASVIAVTNPATAATLFCLVYLIVLLWCVCLGISTERATVQGFAHSHVRLSKNRKFCVVRHGIQQMQELPIHIFISHTWKVSKFGLYLLLQKQWNNISWLWPSSSVHAYRISFSSHLS